MLVYSLAVVTTELTEGREIIIWLGSAGGDLDWECTRGEAISKSSKRHRRPDFNKRASFFCLCLFLSLEIEMCSIDRHGSVRGSTSLIVRASVASLRIRTYIYGIIFFFIKNSYLTYMASSSNSDGI